MPKRESWRKVTDFGADPTGVSDSTRAIDRALATSNHIIFNAQRGLIPADYKYSGTLSVPEGTYIRGQGPGKSRLHCPVVFGSHCVIGGETLSEGLTFGKPSGPSSMKLSDGAHSTTFSNVRFRSYHGNNVWNMSDYVAWSQSPTASPGRNCNARDITFTDCQFEFTGTNVHQFEIWWDVRPGGGSIDGFTWDGCTFGCRNKDGQYPGYNGAPEAYAELLVQPSPPEHGTGGPRPGSSTAYGFDWATKVGAGHGAGLGSEWSDPVGFTLKDCYFVGKSSLGSIDLCCNTRSYYYTTVLDGSGAYLYTADYIKLHPNCSEEERAAMLDQWGTNRGWTFDNVWIADSCIFEIGPRDNPEWDSVGARVQDGGSNYLYPDHQGDGTEPGLPLRYYVPEDVETVDLQLYPNLSSIRSAT